MYFSAYKKLCFKAPYVSFVSAVLRRSRLPRLLFPKQTIPLSLPSICCSLTIYLLVPLTTCAPGGPRSSTSSTPSTWNQGIYKTQSIWAMRRWVVAEVKLTFPKLYLETNYKIKHVCKHVRCYKNSSVMTRMLLYWEQFSLSTEGCIKACNMWKCYSSSLFSCAFYKTIVLSPPHKIH